VAGGSDEAATGLGETAAADDPATVAATRAAGHEAGVEPRESSWLMTVPLVVLAVLSLLGGGLNLPFADDLKVLEHWLLPVVGGSELHIDVATGTKWVLAVVAVVAALVGIGLAAAVYLQRRVRAVEPEVLARGWYFDQAITDFAGGPGRRAFEGIAWFDRTVIDGAVNGVATLVRGVGRGLRRAQPGFVRSYALGLAAGVVIVLGYFLTRLSF